MVFNLVVNKKHFLIGVFTNIVNSSELLVIQKTKDLKVSDVFCLMLVNSTTENKSKFLECFFRGPILLDSGN